MPLIDQWRQEGRLEGRQEGRLEGRQEGHQEGRLEGQRNMLRVLLTERFGALPETAEARIAQATAEDLDTWMRRVLTAASLTEVIA